MTEEQQNKFDSIEERRNKLGELYQTLNDEFGRENTERLTGVDITVEAIGRHGHRQEVMIWHDVTREDRGEGVNQGWMLVIKDGDAKRKKIFNDDFESAVELFEDVVEYLKDGKSGLYAL